MLKRLLLLFFLIISSSSLLSQEPDSLRVGIHQVQNEFYANQPPENYQLSIKDTKIPSRYKPSATRTLRRKVLGWHPYWASSSAYLYYDYSALSHIAYFSYEGGTSEIWRNIIRSFSFPDSGKNIIINIYPNPVHGTSRIEFYLASKEYVTLKIFDLLGKEKEVLVNGELDAGYHSEEFNSIGYGQGLYLCVLQTKKIRSTQTIMVIH